ncbi:MAG: alpha/beta fold hydrolase [Saprospiraceae bacterium]
MKRLTILLCSLILLCLNGHLVTAQAIPQLKLTPHNFVAEDGREIATEMGEFNVLQDRNVPNGRQLTLRFVRFKSTNPNPGSPIVYLAGGPGGSGINAAKHKRHDLFLALRSVADVIAYDQRGTGISDGPPPNPAMWTFDPSTPMTHAAVRPIIQDATKEAANFFKENDADLAAYNSNASADDLNELRLALGAEKISLWSISYGSHLALTTLKRHEKMLDRVVLAGVEGYDHTVKLPVDQQEILESIDELLKADAKTANVYPDFLGDVARLLAKVEKTPAVVTTAHPGTGDTMTVALGKLELQILMSWFLGAPEAFRDLPLNVQQMLDGDFSAIAKYALHTKSGNFRGMSMGMDLASGITPERRKLIELQAKTTLLGDAINFPYLHQYDALIALDAGPDFRTPYPSELPVLCISGTLDGRTAAANAEETLEYLPNGRHLLLEGAGHSDPLFLSSPRILEVMKAYFSGEEVENERIVVSPVDWVLPNE